MSLSGDSVLNRDNLNRAYVSKSATGTQIMAGSLRLLGGVTIDGATTLSALTVGAINAGASAITTTGTITAGTFSGAHSGVGTLLTALNGTNISSGTVADARLSTNVVMLNKAQTFTANNTYSAAANLYFAGGTTYKIDATGSAYFNALQVAGNLTMDGNDYLTFGVAGVAGPADTSVGTKIKLYGNQYQIGIEGNSIWYDSTYNHKFYSNSGTATRTLRAEITETDTHIFTDLNVDKNLEVAGELKAGIANEFPDPLLTSKSTSLWPSTSGGTLTVDSVQVPTGTGAVASLKIVASTADAFSYSSVLFDAIPNEWMTYSFYNFCTTASKAGNIYVQWLDASQVHVSYSGVTFTASTGWTRQKLTAQAPATARFFKIRIGNAGGTGAIMYFAALQVERGKTLTGFKPYAGGATASFFDKGIMVAAGGEIHSAYSNAHIFKDHNNGNITLSGAGASLYIGYQNTTKVVLSADLYASNNTTKIVDRNTGALYYQGIDTDSRYVNVSGDSMTGALSVSDSGATLFSVTRTSTTGNVGISYSNSSNTLHAGAVLGASSADFGIGTTADLATAKFKVNAMTGEITVNGNKVWHAGNDGSGSGLDADLLDGLDSSQFIRRDASDSASGNHEFYATDITGHYGNSAVEIREVNVVSTGQSSPAYAPALAFHWGGRHAAQLALESDGVFTLRDGTNHTVNRTLNAGNLQVTGNNVWHSGNDGAGSGLDADTVDGVQLSGIVQTSRSILTSTGLTGGGTLSANRTLSFDTVWGDARYLAVGAKSADSEKLDGLDSTQFLRNDMSGSITGNLNTDGDLSFSRLAFLKGIAGAHREGGNVNLLSRLSGRIVNRNPDFINSTTGYNFYDNSGSGRLIRSMVSDDVIPNSTGKLIRYDYDPARNATTSASPGFGGFTLELPRKTGVLDSWGYRAGNRYIFRLIAKIPIGRNIEFASNVTGNESGGEWLTSVAGTGDWQEYVYMYTIGITGTFGTTGYYYIYGGTDTAFTWDVASVHVIGIDEIPDVDRAPTLNVGYKPGVDVGWGEIYSTGKITSDSNIESTNGDFITKNNSLLGLRNAAGTSWINLQDTTGHTWIKNSTAGKGIYLDSDLMYIRNAAGTNQISVAANGDTTIVNNLTVSKAITTTGITVAKTGNISTITFPAGSGGNDPGYISHDESVANSAKMFFVVSDDAADNDYFGFGSTTQKENAKITALGNATFKATTVTSLTSSGNVTISGDLSIPTGNSDKAAVTIGAVTIGQETANSGQLIITNLSELRFGTATNATWTYNSWGGIKYITTSNTMVIGGPASANFAANAAPPRINLNFEGVAQANLDGKMVISPTVTSTIGGATMANGYLLIGSIADGIAFDPNEMYFSGGTGIIGTIGAYDLSFQPGGVARMTVSSTGASVVGSIAATGEVSGTKMTASGGVSVPSGQNIYIGTYGDSAASLRLHYNGTSAYTDFGGDLYFRSNTTERMRLSAAGNLGVKVAPSASYGISTDSILVSNWLRTTGSTGWYSETHGGGWNMSDATWIRNFGSKSVFIAGSTSVLRAEGILQVGAGTTYTAAADLQVVSGASGTFNYRNVIWSDGLKVGIGSASALHPLDVTTTLGAQGINIHTTGDALTNGLSYQNAAGTYSWHLARNGTNASPDLVLYGGSHATLSSLAERVRYYNNGDTNFAGHMFVRGGSGLTGTPAIALAIGDTDTGLDWVQDGVLKIMANNVAIGQFASTYMNLNVTTTITGGKDLVIKAASADAGDIIFQASSGTEYARVYSNPGALYLSAGTSPSPIATVTATGLGVTGKTTSSSGYATGNFEIVHNTAEDSLDFVYLG